MLTKQWIELLTDLANTPDEGLEGLRRKWWDLSRSLSEGELLKVRDELRLIWLKSCDLPKPPPNPKRAMKWLEKPFHRPLQEEIVEDWMRRATPLTLSVRWGEEERRIVPPANSLLGILAFACVDLGGRFAYCWLEECKKPYFIAERSNERYCSKECREGARRETKRTWWRENLGKEATK
jgi:hypothetical protein